MVVEFLWTLRNGFRMRNPSGAVYFVQDIFKDAALKRPGDMSVKASYPDTSNVWVYDCVWAACQVITSVGLSNRWKI